MSPLKENNINNFNNEHIQLIIVKEPTGTIPYTPIIYGLWEYSTFQRKRAMKYTFVSVPRGETEISNGET